MGFDKNSWLSETSSNSKRSILRPYWRPRALHLFTQRLLFILTVLAKSVDEAPSHLLKSCRCDIFFRYDSLLSAQTVAALGRVVPHLSRRFITPYKESAWFVVACQVVLQVTSVGLESTITALRSFQIVLSRTTTGPSYGRIHSASFQFHGVFPAAGEFR